MPHVSTSLFFSRADCASGASAVLRATLHSPWSLVVFFFRSPKEATPGTEGRSLLFICLLACTADFWQRRSHANDRAAIDVGQGIVVQSQLDYFDVQQLDLEGQRFAFCFFGSIKKVCFITLSTEPVTLSIFLPNRKCRPFSAW